VTPFRGVVLGVLLCTASACRSPEPAAKTPITPETTLRPVTLPDLSGMEPAVQQQIREADAAVTALAKQQQDGHAPPAGLGAAYGALGNLLFAADNLDAAADCYHDAQLLDPGEPRWPYYLGQVHRSRGELPASIASFERALQLQPNQLATLVWLGNAYLEQDRAGEAAPLFAKAQSIDPRSVAALFGLGRAALAQRRYAEAVSAFEQALTIDPRATIVHYPLALAYRGLGQADKADAHIRQRGTVDVSPDDPWLREITDLLQGAVALENRGVRALNAGQYADAVVLFKKGVQQQPGRASLHHQLGTALALTGDVRGALAELQEAIRLEPTLAKAHYSLGVLLAGNPAAREPAAAELSAAVRYDPGYVEARTQLAGLYRLSGRYQDALTQYEQAVALDPRAVDAQLGYVMTLANLKRYRDARDRAREAVAALPAPALTLALIRLLAAAPDRDVRDGTQALQLAGTLASDPRAQASPDVAEAMAMALAETGQYDEAARWQAQAMALADRAGRADLARRMTDNLQLYQRHLPCRTPWRDS
jgi:tetratricopeptide (TPR) repeat protein